MTYPVPEAPSQPTPGHIPEAGPGGMQYGHTYPTTGPANMKSLDGIQDFTPERADVRFRIGQDVFSGVTDVPALSLIRFAAKNGEALDKLDEDNLADLGEEEISAITDLMRLLLVTDSADLFIHRMESPENPIGIQTYMNIVPWLMEQYGMRPTEPSSGSADGSPNPDDGTPSTATSAVVESTSSPSPYPVA